MQAQAGEGAVRNSAPEFSLLEAYKHHHFSERGTPVVHAFNIEPAFTGRDLFATYRYISANDHIEHETELEMEWGITRRLGIIFELPYIIEDERRGPSNQGFGDLIMVPRVLLHESDRLLLTAQAEIALPTGDSDFGGDNVVVPGLAAWYDLGNWWTLQGLVGWENNFSEDESALEWGLGIIKSFDLRGHGGECDHSHHRTHAGLLNFHLEFTGETELSDGGDGATHIEGLIGISHGLDCGIDIRVGYQVPITRPTELDYSWVIGANWHF